jgi:hypothetical protein
VAQADRAPALEAQSLEFKPSPTQKKKKKKKNKPGKSRDRRLGSWKKLRGESKKLGDGRRHQKMYMGIFNYSVWGCTFGIWDQNGIGRRGQEGCSYKGSFTSILIFSFFFFWQLCFLTWW